MLGELILLHGLVAIAIVAFGRRLGRNVFVLGAVAPLVAFGWLLAHADDAHHTAVTQSFSWVPQLGLDLDLRLNGIALLFGLLISGIGVLVMGYSRWYFPDGDPTTKVASLLVAFAGAMLGLVLADNLFVLFGFWELTTVTSYLLIGYEDTKAAARVAAQQAFLVTGIGSLAMLAGLVLLGQAAGTYSLTAVLADPPGGGVVPAALALILAGAFTKSAQVPWHFWLPGAMSAPTPISTYLHSATMVKAGVYLIALLAPAFAATVGWWTPVVVGVGIATMIWGGARALRQTDLKLLAAYGTVSQLGLMVALVGAGRPELTFAGCAVILAHALFKATLFMVVGIVDHHAGSRDLRDLHDLYKKMPTTAIIAVIAAASMAGLPPLFGFVAKEAALGGLVDQIDQVGGVGWLFATVGVVIGSMITFAYGARFVLGGFGSFGSFGPYRRGDTIIHDQHHDHGDDHRSPAWVYLWPPMVLTVLTVAFGLVPSLVQSLVSGAAEVLEHPLMPLAGPAETTGEHATGIVDTAAHAVEHLALWHGFNAALGLSAVAILGGVLLVIAHRRIERAQTRFGGFKGGTQAYSWSLSRLLHVADRVTGAVQNGSLPVYLGVILTTMVVLPGSSLLLVRDVDVDLVFSENPLQAVVAGLVIGFALATAVARRRFAAVLLLGGVGYGIVVLFVLQGAPDLALTQMLIETLSLVLFFLVVRFLPDEFRHAPGGVPRSLRLVIAVGVGAFVTAFALLAASSRTEVPVSVEQIARSQPDGGGSNVVNVIINDIRGLDTMGEITVLVTASLGVATLAAVARRRPRPDGSDDPVLDGPTTDDPTLDDAGLDDGVLDDGVLVGGEREGTVDG